MKIYIKQIKAIDAHPLRITELDWIKSHSSISLPEDEHATTLHLGAFFSNGSKDQLVGILTCVKNKLSDNADSLLNKYNCNNFHWQIRGMAVDSNYRNNNIGSLLLTELQNILMKTETNLGLWANARINAIKFYQNNGFHATGDVFIIKGAGDHYKIIKKISEN